MANSLQRQNPVTFLKGKLELYLDHNEWKTDKALELVRAYIHRHFGDSPTSKCEDCVGQDPPCADMSTCVNCAILCECAPNCIKGCRNQRISNREYAPVYVQQTLGKGVGLFAARDINKGEFVCEYVGQVYDGEEGVDDRTYEVRQMGIIIHPTLRGNEGQLCNHSCSPNSEMMLWIGNDNLPHLMLTTKEKVKKDSEVTYNYGEKYSLLLKCICGAPNCISKENGSDQNYSQPKQASDSNGENQTSQGETETVCDPSSFKCTNQNCTKVFATKANMKRHAKFSCIFTSGSNLQPRKHAYTISNLGISDEEMSNLNCRDCKELFSTLKALARHKFYHCKFKEHAIIKCPLGCTVTFSTPYDAEIHAKNYCTLVE